MAKLDATGAHVWSKRFGDGTSQQGIGVTADNAGAVLVTGNVQGAMVDFGFGPLPDGGGWDVVVAKLSP